MTEYKLAWRTIMIRGNLDDHGRSGMIIDLDTSWLVIGIFTFRLYERKT
jgi:hypothetical protein